MRPIPGKALFFRRGAQTGCREKAPAAVGVCASFPGKPYSSVERRKPFTREEPPPPAGVCASHPGKPYSSVERRKPFTGKRRRRLREFAPHSRESLILPLRGANRLPGKGAGGRGSLRLLPGKALFFRREAQTLHPGRAPAAGGSLRLTPGKALFFR